MKIILSLIYKYWLEFRAGKKPSSAITKFEYDLIENLRRLSDDLASGCYKHGDYQYRVIRDPKERLITVASVRDRVVHRILYDKLVDLYDKSFDYDVWSCRRGKGLLAMNQRVQQLMNRYQFAHIWRADIQKFFDSVDQTKLKEILRRKISDMSLFDLLEKVIDSTGRGTGIPIGNLTSQILANIYLNELDRYVRTVIKPLAYLRYGDDFLVFERGREKCEKTQRLGTTFLRQNLRLAINPRNNIITTAHSGVKFCGSDIFASGSAIIRRTFSRTVGQPFNSGRCGYVSKFGGMRQKDCFLFRHVIQLCL
jgi:retron-type reverse transcriptase